MIMIGKFVLAVVIGNGIVLALLCIGANNAIKRLNKELDEEERLAREDDEWDRQRQ